MPSATADLDTVVSDADQESIEYDLMRDFENSLDRLYTNLKSELSKSVIFQVQYENYFSGITFTVYNGETAPDEYYHSSLFVRCFMRICMKLVERLKAESKNVICDFLRLIILHPMFMKSQGTHKRKGNLNRLGEQFGDIIPSNESYALEQDILEASFRDVESKLQVGWCKANKLQLVYVFKDCLEMIDDYNSSDEVSLKHFMTKVYLYVVQKLFNATIRRKNQHFGNIIGPDVFLTHDSASAECYEMLKSPESKPCNPDILLIAESKSKDIEIPISLISTPADSVTDFDEVAYDWALCNMYKHAFVQMFVCKRNTSLIATCDSFTVIQIAPGSSIDDDVDPDGQIARPKCRYFQVIREGGEFENDLRSSSSITPLMLLLMLMSDGFPQGGSIECMISQSLNNLKQGNITRYQRDLNAYEQMLLHDSEYIERLGIEDFQTIPLEVMLNGHLYLSYLKLKRVVIQPPYINSDIDLPIVKRLGSHDDISNDISYDIYLVDKDELSRQLGLALDTSSRCVVLKFLNIENIDSFVKSYAKSTTLEEQASGIYKHVFKQELESQYDKFVNEVTFSSVIDQYNELDPMGKINKPKVLQYGKLVQNGPVGFFLVEEHLNFYKNKPETKHELGKGYEQMERLHRLFITHGDIAKCNVCFNEANDDFYFYNFRYSMITNMNSPMRDKSHDEWRMSQLLEDYTFHYH